MKKHETSSNCSSSYETGTYAELSAKVTDGLPVLLTKACNDPSQCNRKPREAWGSIILEADAKGHIYLSKKSKDKRGKDIHHSGNTIPEVCNCSKKGK